jgi:hypothetical protein
VRYVIAIDPGKNTGFAAWSSERGEAFFADQEPDFYTMCRRLEVFLEARSNMNQEVALVVERFIINVKTVGNSQAPWSLEMIGVARYLAQHYACEFVLQSPSDAKNFMNDTRLKKLSWYKPGKVHANDASRHLGLFLATRKLIDLTELM